MQMRNKYGNSRQLLYRKIWHRWMNRQNDDYPSVATALTVFHSSLQIEITKTLKHQYVVSKHKY